jgi:hypothetical protein
MKLNNLQVTNPISGQKVGLFDIKAWMSLLFGVVALMVLYKWGTNLGNVAFNKIPSAARNYGATPVDANTGISVY